MYDRTYAFVSRAVFLFFFLFKALLVDREERLRRRESYSCWGRETKERKEGKIALKILFCFSSANYNEQKREKGVKMRQWARLFWNAFCMHLQRFGCMYTSHREQQLEKKIVAVQQKQASDAIYFYYEWANIRESIEKKLLFSLFSPGKLVFFLSFLT